MLSTAALLLLLLLCLAGGGECEAVRHPMVFFPGYGSTILQVDVEGQEMFPACPKSGSYSIYFGYDPNQGGFGELCTMQLLKILFDPTTGQFSSVPGVSVSIPNFGQLNCTQDYGTLFHFLELQGFREGVDLFVAGFDWRTAPGVDLTGDHKFIDATKRLVEDAFKASGNSRVYLTGHSNGPPMMQGFLNSQSTIWKEKYIGSSSLILHP